MSNDLGLDYLSPSEPLGMFLLIFGAFFTAGIVYIFLNLDKDSLSEKKRKVEQEKEREKKIDKLYPKLNKKK